MIHRKIRHNLRPAVIIVLIPVVLGVFALVFVFSEPYKQLLAAIGATRLTTTGWERLDTTFKEAMPDYERKFAYYQLQENEDVAKVSQHFGVPVETLTALNPGQIVAGTTIKVPPVESPLLPVQPNGLLRTAQVSEEQGVLHVRNDFQTTKIITNIPELMELLRQFDAITLTGPMEYRINRPISLDENIRLDITGETVKKLALKSKPNGDIVCLCIEDGEMLIKDTAVTSVDPATGQPDYSYEDHRSFIRALKSTRMDVINSTISYLGSALQPAGKPRPVLFNEGGMYGISWRIPDDRLGKDIVTGWVEDSIFYKNHFGSYTFGASGMMWKNNHFLENDVYGLDPHDDSNNALVVGNVFEKNGKHGFIVSKRCNYNVIKGNISFGNALHGYMLHQDSAYNVIENNLAYDNTDNFAIYASNNNMIRNNRSFNARGSHIRINARTINTFVMNNTIAGGKRGMYLYDNVKNVYATGNTFQDVHEVIKTEGANFVLFTNNTVSGLYYSLASEDRIVFGPNGVSRVGIQVPARVGELRRY